jgi:hypothetical protein
MDTNKQEMIDMLTSAHEKRAAYWSPVLVASGQQQSIVVLNKPLALSNVALLSRRRQE